MQLPQQRPLQQLPHPLKIALSAMAVEWQCGAMSLIIPIAKLASITPSDVKFLAKAGLRLSQVVAAFAAPFAHFRSLHLVLLCTSVQPF